jgi:hypothetical protein
MSSQNFLLQRIYGKVLSFSPSSDCIYVLGLLRESIKLLKQVQTSKKNVIGMYLQLRFNQTPIFFVGRLFDTGPMNAPPLTAKTTKR